MAVRESEYTGRFLIPAPRGVYQAAGDTDVSIENACRAHNIRTGRGVLASSYGTSRALPSLGAPIQTLTQFTRRTRPDDPQVFVAAAGGKLYTYTMGTEGWVMRAEGFASDKWSDVTYEAVRNEETVDVLILSNDRDGMVVIYGDDLSAERKALHIGENYGEVKFAVLGRYAERIFGTGAPGYPDSVFYSRPYDPFDFSPVDETPELGGGVISHPTWDGDSFMALESFGGCLLAIKRRTVFEIRGTDPSSFTISQAFGTDGPLEARTVCAEGQSLLFLSEDGVGLYDGAGLGLLSRDALFETMKMRMEGTQALATAAVCAHVYYLALCVKENEGDVIAQNNCVIEYDTQRGTFMLRKGMRVKDFYALGGQLYFTQADAPYDVLCYRDEKAHGYLGETMECLWETPWLSLDKAAMKRDFVLRFTAEAGEEATPLELTVITDRREKTRTALLHKRRSDYRVKIQLSGKRMKLRIRSRSAAPFEIIGGIEVAYTMDEA